VAKTRSPHSDFTCIRGKHHLSCSGGTQQVPTQHPRSPGLRKFLLILCKLSKQSVNILRRTSMSRRGITLTGQ
ncbi:unnamed protein product, partial [Nesidiocoris tenuis]